MLSMRCATRSPPNPSVTNKTYEFLETIEPNPQSPNFYQQKKYSSTKNRPLRRLWRYERVRRIELPSQPWEGRVLPLYNTRECPRKMRGIFNLQFSIFPASRDLA